MQARKLNDDYVVNISATEFLYSPKVIFFLLILNHANNHLFQMIYFFVITPELLPVYYTHSLHREKYEWRRSALDRVSVFQLQANKNVTI